jgi:predicted phage-related endonuclease
MKRRTIAVAKDDPIPSLQPKATVAKASVAADVVEFFSEEEYPQGSEEWFRLRLGMPTASNFAAIMAGGEGKMRASLMRRMAGEILTDQLAETFKSEAMARGNEMEAEARDRFAFTNNVELERVGFVRRTLPNGRFVGCSPDSLIGKDGVLEVKTMRPDLMIELIESGRFPTEHRAQVHGSLWVTGRSVCKLVIYYRGMPVTPTFTVERDDRYIAEIAEAVEVFDYELRKMVERIRGKGK